MQLSVIIVNYNVKYFLEQCLCSVTKAVQNINAEIFVVDNNSTDNTRDFFLEKFTQANFIWNTENMGFSKANNIALQQAKGEYILFLNPDTIVPEDGFEKCISFFKSNPNAGALGVKMLDGSGNFLKESKRSYPSPLTSLYKLSGLSRLFPHSKTFSKYHLGNLNKNENNEVDVLAGAFLMVPKKVLDVVGSFDESFFMYGEDIDLSYRIQQAGFKNFYFPEVQMLHFKGESTKKGGLNYVRLFYSAMSIFAKKNYGSGKAAFFNFFIQIAIFIRAFFSACARFLKWVGMPAVDTAIILLSFWTIKLLWSTYIKKEVNYSPNMLIIAFPVFTSIFLVIAYFTGLYDNGFKQRRLNQSAIIAFLTLLAIYGLLPEDWRFSRGILVFGCVLAFILIAFVRWLLIKWKIIERAEKENHDQVIVVASQKEFEEVYLLLQTTGMKERILGRVSIGEIAEPNTIGSVIQIKYLLKKYPVKEIIFCEGTFSFKQMIQVISDLNKNIKIKIHSKGSASIVGSDSKNETGKFISTDKNFNLSGPVALRNKRFIDVIISLFFIITFPFHLFHKKPLQFFKNVFEVLLLRKTWVGYSAQNKNLPKLETGVITSTGLPSILNSLPPESLYACDEWYASDYTIWKDLKIIYKGYKILSS